MFEKRSVLVITGLYGSGKASLAQHVQRKLNLTIGRAYSPCRSWAKGERDYNYVSCNGPDGLGETLCYEDIFGNDCAIRIEELESADIFIADINAAEFIQSCYAGNSRIKIIQINSPEAHRRERLKRRGLADTEIDDIFRREAESVALRNMKPDAELDNSLLVKKALDPLSEYILRTAIAFDEDIKRLAYGVYSSEWLLEHGITFPALIETISEWIAGAYGAYSANEIKSILWRGIIKRSYKGEHFLSREEFLSSLYRDEYYRDNLLYRMTKHYHMIDFLQERKAEIA